MIYLDHNATTPILPEVVDSMLPWLRNHWGNPSSIYAPGREARRALEEARFNVAKLVGAQPEQIVFTSGATEANNAALHSALLRDPSRRHLITSAVEHSAVLAYCDYLERNHGVEVTRLPVDLEGGISIDTLKEAIRSDTALVSLMWANNETGVIWPVPELAGICSSSGVPFHTDAVQAVGKLPVNFADCGADFLSLSGHKFGAPKGIGALIVADPSKFLPLIYGGKQETGHRGGTENVAQIVALGAAAGITNQGDLELWIAVTELRDAFERNVCGLIDGAQINGEGSPRLANTSNIYFPGTDGDALVAFLDRQDICVSSGSACLESAITPSHVIFAMTDSHDRASESIRISLSLDTTAEDLQQLVTALQAFGALVN